MDLNHAIEMFLLFISANGYSSSTRDLYLWAMNLMSGFLINPELKSIKSNDLERFWKWLREDYKPKRMNRDDKPLSGRSLENIWTAERSFFRWCLESGKLAKRPDLTVRKPEYAERIIEPLTCEEVNLLLIAAERTRPANTTKRAIFTSPRPTAKRDIAIIMVLGDTGIRVSECARLTVADVDLVNGYIVILPHGSGRKTVHLKPEIGKHTRLAIMEYLAWREQREGSPIDGDAPLFVSMKDNAMNKDSIRQVLNDIGKSAGIPNVHPHRFRHFFASMLAADDAAETELMEKLGHSTGKMARRYVHAHKFGRERRESTIDRSLKNRNKK